MADLKMMLQNLRDKSKCCKKDDFTGERYTIIHDMSIESLNMICEDGIEQLENAQIVNRWIPRRERMPEVDTDVIVFYPSLHSNPIQIAHLNYDKLSFELSDGEFHFPASAVTHWMPLPEPPAFCGGLVEGGADDAT